MYCMVCCVVIQKKVLDDIHKRVDCFAAQWKNKKLSDPVKLSMTRLVDGTGVINIFFIATHNFILPLCSPGN